MQIHFCNGNHWVTSSCIDGHINLYDSLPAKKLSSDMEEQLARIYGHLGVQGGGLAINHVPVQWQKGFQDCGLFAIVFAYHAANGDDLATIKFHQGRI